MRKCTLSFSSVLVFAFVFLAFSGCKGVRPDVRKADVLVIGGGTGAISAAIQSARSGAETILVHPYPWLGGMLTAAGVSATDGNHHLPAGLWGEFRSMLRAHYGGADSLFTGWVSNTMFEPRVGAEVWSALARREEMLTIYLEAEWKLLEKQMPWKVEVTNTNGEKKVITPKILVDGTDLGDVAAEAGARFDLGMDARAVSGESIAPEQSNDIVQDLTYVAILKDYGEGRDMTITKPSGYDPGEFTCTCKHAGCMLEDALDCEQMMTYGKLPGSKYMINWPRHGNDFGVNMVEMNQAKRDSVIAMAKAKTLRYIYFLQHELGFSHLGLADDEFPTDDLLPFYPYHREGRRIEGIVRMNLAHITEPYDDGLYRTGIAVGDYPIDHHHDEVPEAPELDFPPVPSYSVPMGCLIPAGVDGLVIADKAISVTNIVNGTTRLQPVVIQTGQAAGLMAAMASLGDVPLYQLDPRTVQQRALEYGGYLLPYVDVSPEDPHFTAIQKIGATGILRGEGVPYKWANRTYFYPDSIVNAHDLARDLDDFREDIGFEVENMFLSVAQAIDLVYTIASKQALEMDVGNAQEFVKMIQENWTNVYQLPKYEPDRYATKRELAVLLDQVCDLFQHKKVDLHGNWK